MVETVIPFIVYILYVAYITYKIDMAMIEVKLRDYTCSDGCCYETYYDVYLNDKLIGSTECESADSVIDFINEHFNIEEK